MTRLLVLLLAALLALGAAPAFAQDEPVVDEPPVETVEPDPDEDVVPAEPDPDEDIVPPPGDEGGCVPGEGDYEYCEGIDCIGDAGDYGDYGDYAYCPSATGEPPEPRVVEDDGGGGPGGGSGAEPPAAVRAVDTTTLPYTGIEPGLVGLFGLGLLMVGAGARLRLARR